MRLNRGVSAIGLVMAIYEEASIKGVVRQTAKDLLIRKIHERFPEGWSSQGDVHPLVKIGRWDSEVSNYGHDSKIAHFASCIMRNLTIDHPPPEGWKPEPRNDPLIDELFDRYWPVERK